ncbi:MAG: hypothetical protein KatS3mg096_573 [Candidatus Parcubacteria bacterium]|nr:MAG: hypothetical protein KatS3mg096_573 [Candidatus Parcubacteria bacterium]
MSEVINNDDHLKIIYIGIGISIGVGMFIIISYIFYKIVLEEK